MQLSRAPVLDGEEESKPGKGRRGQGAARGRRGLLGRALGAARGREGLLGRAINSITGHGVLETTAED